MAENQPVDQAAIDKLQKMGGAGFVQQMISLFVDFGGKKVKEARAALEEQNFQTVEKCVHAIRSSAMNLGASQVWKIASEMEDLTREHSTQTLPLLQSQLEKEFALVKSSLERKAEELEENS